MSYEKMSNSNNIGTIYIFFCLKLPMGVPLFKEASGKERHIQFYLIFYSSYLYTAINHYELKTILTRVLIVIFFSYKIINKNILKN